VRARRPKRAARRLPRGHAAGSVRPAGFAVITVSDTRTPRTDVSGKRAEVLVEQAGHAVRHRDWVRDRRVAIRRAARTALALPSVDVVIVTGGTGVAPRDVTPESLEPIYDRPLPGFGEWFRALSCRQVGSAAWLSRASAGVVRGKLLVLLPGSPRAVELALRKLLLPELAHVLRLTGRHCAEE
jgi:molybdenum cofactor biosynthesis protein B